MMYIGKAYLTIRTHVSAVKQRSRISYILVDRGTRKDVAIVELTGAK